MLFHTRDGSVDRAPLMVTVPEAVDLALVGRRPAIILRRVDLPHPGSEWSDVNVHNVSNVQ